MYLSRKYQVGGIAYTPYLSAPPGSAQESITAPSGGTSKSSSPEKISGTIKKEIIDLLKENGIPSDVSTFLNAANGFLQKSQSLSGMSLFGGTNDDYDLTDLIKIQQMVNDVKYNNALKDAATKQLTEEMAGSEVAVTDNGHIYAQDKDGNITTVSPETYAKNKDSYTPLTNNQLLYLREHDNGLSFQTGILNDLRNTIGMKTITDYLKGQITSFGKDEKGGYATKDNPVVRGMEVLMAAGPDGYYKFKDENQLRDVNAAIKYLYNGLTPNAKNLLKAKTAADGGDPTNMTDVCDLILQALTIFPDRSQTVDFDKTATEFDPMGTGKKGGSSKEQLTKDTYQIRFGEGRGLPTQVLLTPTAAKIFETGTMLAQGTDFGPMEDWDNKQLGQMNLPKLLKEWALGTSVRNADITFGNKLLDYSELPTVMYDGQSLTTSVYLPYKEENGHYTPDFELFQRFNAFKEAAKDISPIERNTLLKKYGLDSKDIVPDPETGGFKLKNTMRFVTFSAYAGDDTLNLSKDNKLYLEKVSRAKGITLKDPYNKALKYNDIYADKKSKLINNKFEKAWANEFWKGNVYIAAPDAFYGYNSSSDQYVPKEQLSQIDRKVIANEQILQMLNNAQETDPNYWENTQIGQFR